MLASGLFGYLTDYLLWWVLLLSLFVHTSCFFRVFPRRRRPVAGLVFGNTLLFLCLMGAAAMAGESYFRFLAMETDSFGMSLPARRWFVFHTKLNSLGSRDVEWEEEKPRGVYRIAFVGDSFTYGWGIERIEDRFPERIEAELEKQNPGAFEIMNVAKPGWDTGEQFRPIADIIDRFAVDEIVLCYVANDIEKLIPTGPGFNPTHPPMPTFFDLDRSALLEYLYWRLYVPRVASVAGYHDWLADGYGNESIWRSQQQRLYDIIRFCRERRVVLRVVLLPFMRTGGDRYNADRLHGVLSEFIETHDCEMLDLLDTIADQDPADLVVSGTDAHPNELAHKLFADAIFEAFYARGGP